MKSATIKELKEKFNPIKGTQLISKANFENTLKTRFGLSLDDDMICKYIDTHPQNKEFYTIDNPPVFTISFKDEIGHDWANTEGRFYKEHTTRKTELFKEFREFKENYTFKIGKYFYI